MDCWLLFLWIEFDGVCWVDGFFECVDVIFWVIGFWFVIMYLVLLYLCSVVGGI